MNKADALLFVNRWKAVEEIEREELRAMTFEQHWQKLNAIARFAIETGMKREDDDGERAGAGADGTPADHVGQVFGGDRVEHLGGHRQAQLVDLQQQAAREVAAQGDAALELLAEELRLLVRTGWVRFLAGEDLYRRHLAE